MFWTRFGKLLTFMLFAGSEEVRVVLAVTSARLYELKNKVAWERKGRAELMSFYLKVQVFVFLGGSYEQA